MQELLIQYEDKLGKKIDRCGEVFRTARAVLLDEAGRTLRGALQGHLSSSGLQDRDGKVSGWQRVYRGSGGGYVAVRALAGATGPDSPGAITNYLESGHRVRYPSGKSERYRPRVRVARARAFRFYKATQAEARQLGERWANELERRLKESLEA